MLLKMKLNFVSEWCRGVRFRMGLFETGRFWSAIGNVDLAWQIKLLPLSACKDLRAILIALGMVTYSSLT